MTDSPRLRQLRAMLADDPGDPFTRYAVGLELAGLGDHAAAVAALTELAAASPDYVPTYLMLGQQLQRLGRDSETIDVLKRGIEIARRLNETHALGEMQALLDSLT